MKIDVFNHILPKAYFDRITSVMPVPVDMHKRVRSIPTLVDLDARFRIMDPYDDYVQVISLAGPPVDEFGPPAVTVPLARLANDAMAELVQRHGDRLALALELLRDPVFDALRDGSSAFEDLPKVLAAMAAGAGPVLSHVVAYGQG